MSSTGRTSHRRLSIPSGSFARRTSRLYSPLASNERMKSACVAVPGGTVELLDRRRRDYLELEGRVERFVAVDASQPLEQVVAEVAGVIREVVDSAPTEAPQRAARESL